MLAKLNGCSSSANELENSLHSENSKLLWSSAKMTDCEGGAGNGYTRPPLYDGSTGELVYDDKTKTDLQNQYFCSSIISINDTNRERALLCTLANKCYQI